MELLRQAAYLNSEGAFLIALGNHEKATNSLKAAYQIITSLKWNSFPQPSSQAAESFVPPCIVFNSLDTSDSDNDSFHIFNQTIEFIIGGTRTAMCEDEDDLSFYTAIILFNMGLAHHKQGKDRNNANQFFQSIQFYEMSLSILDDNAVDSEWSQQLMMATLNNLAHIHFVLGRTDEAREKMELLKIMRYSLYMCDSSNCVVKERDLDQFLLNTIVTDPPSVAPCA